MKKSIIVCMLFVSIVLSAQEQQEYRTIFGGKEKGGYGSFSFGYSPIDSVSALTFSARGGIILNHTLSMGLAGSGFISEYHYENAFNQDGNLTGGYGGVFAELILLSRSPVHISVPLVAGIGGIAYSAWENEGTQYERVNYVKDVSTFLVFEPGVELEFNLSKFFRMAGYITYRYTTDIDLTTVNTSGNLEELVPPEALNSYSAGIIFKFGKF